MALTGSFGMPEPRSNPQPRHSGFPNVFVLMVTQNIGGFAREVPAAAGVERDELEIYLGEWLKLDNNRQTYASSRIIPVPFITPT